MTARNFDKAMELVFKSEGGYVDDPKDRGGATNLGITFAVLQAWRGTPITKQDVRKLTHEEAAQIYKKQYWDAVKGDVLPDGLDYAMFDYAVNSGPSRAIKSLQRVLGVKEDGVLGLLTLEKIAASRADLPQKLADERLRFLKQTYGWSRFGAGWSKRVARVTTHADRFTKNIPDFTTIMPEVPVAPTNRADQTVDPVKTGQGKMILASAAGTVGVTATTVAEQLEPLGEISQTIKYIAIGLMIFGVLVGGWLKFKELNN